jgi:recombination protein RecA
MGDAAMGMGPPDVWALRKSAIKQTNTAVIFTNQLRQDWRRLATRNHHRRHGAQVLRLVAWTRRIQSIKLGPEIIGNHCAGCAVKNKVAPPFRTAELTSCTTKASRAPATC